MAPGADQENKRCMWGWGESVILGGTLEPITIIIATMHGGLTLTGPVLFKRIISNLHWDA